MPIQQINMKLICLALLILGIQSICPNPQKSIYLSLQTLSNLDYLQNLFNSIAEKSQSYYYLYNDNENHLIYLISNLTYKLLYNNHFQKQDYLDSNSIKVTLGPINVIAEMTVKISQQTTQQQIYNGSAFIKSFLDPVYFTKKIINQSGYIQWEPQIVPNMTFSFLWLMEATKPYLPQANRDTLISTFRIRNKIQNQINALYSQSLKTFLNSQKIMSITDIDYSYRNLKFTVKHQPKSIVIDKKNAGLKVSFLFGVNSAIKNQTDCPDLPTDFDQVQFGGKQEIISFSTLKFIIGQAIQRGLYKVRLDKTWEVLVFQFYMGDLSNAVPAANSYTADLPFIIDCEPSSFQNSTILPFDDSSIYVQLPQRCVISLNSTDLLAVDMQLILIAKLLAMQDHLSVRIAKTQTRNVKFTAIDSKFTVQRQQVAQMILKQMLDNLVSQTVFGQKFPILYRRYPSLIIQPDYLLLFDPSQIYN